MNWVIIVGVIFVISGLASLFTNFGAAVLTLVVGGILLYFGLLKKGVIKKKETNRPKETPYPQNTAKSVPVSANAKPAASAETESQRIATIDAVPEVIKQEDADENDNVKTYQVTGVQHYFDNLFQLATKSEYYQLSKKELVDMYLYEEKIWENEFRPLKVEVIPEPDNPHDPNAIKVVVDGQHVGYIKAGSCAHLLRVIKEDRIREIKCKITGGPYKYISAEYDVEKNKDVYTLERDKAPYFVDLYITES